MQLCPYCGQEDLWTVRIDGLITSAVMCEECDTVWNDNEPVSKETGLNYEDFMTRRGEQPDWNRIQWQSQVD